MRFVLDFRRAGPGREGLGREGLGARGRSVRHGMRTVGGRRPRRSGGDPPDGTRRGERPSGEAPEREVPVG